MLNQQKGMTLLSLVATIVAMLALVAIAIAMVLDELSYNPEPVQVESSKSIISTDNANKLTPSPETTDIENPQTNM